MKNFAAERSTFSSRRECIIFAIFIDPLRYSNNFSSISILSTQQRYRPTLLCGS